ncbi:type II toxin-antitoxin system HicB family antitoxin [Thalassotalea ganghwensis]
MKYPVKIIKSRTDQSYELTIPDLPGCQLKSESVETLLDGCQKIIADHLAILSEYGENIPTASLIDELIKQQPNAIWALVDFDIVPYLGKSHKINVTLPELLIKKIDDIVSISPEHKTRSGFIANACISLLERSR